MVEYTTLLRRHPAGALAIGSEPPRGGVLRRFGFTDLVLCAWEVQPPDEAFHGVRVHRVQLDDSGLPPTALDFRNAEAMSAHVAALVQQGRSVLVTCHAGINRSGLVSALALRRLTGESGRKIRAYMRAKRQRVVNGHIMKPLSNEHFAAYVEKKRALASTPLYR